MAATIAIFLFSSCAKDQSQLADKTSAENLSTADQKQVNQIKDFTALMSESEVKLRSGGDGSAVYTPAEFIKNTEESINYTYATPFDKYWSVETKKDTMIISINNCKVLASEAPSRYNQILNKVICHYNCININNKKLKVVKINVITTDCTSIKISVSTTVGSTDIPLTANEPLPLTEAARANYRRTFNSDWWGTNGTCASTHTYFDRKVSVEVGKKVTYNLNGGTTFNNYSVINTQYLYLTAYSDPAMNWWFIKCEDFAGSPCDIPTVCDAYFNLDAQGNIDYNSLNQAGLDLYCLTSSELNAILTSTESYMGFLISALNKDFVNLKMNYNSTLCQNAENIF